MQLSFFQTIPMTEGEVKAANRNALRQEWRIYDILEKAGTHLTPFECQLIYNRHYNKTPIGSIRRALTRGTKAGIFEKVLITKKGIYGMNNWQWRHVPNIDKSKIKIR